MDTYDLDFMLTSHTGDLSEEELSRLYQHTSGDCTASYRNGTVFLTFSREADSEQEAIASAVEDVRKAGLGTPALLT